MKLKNESVITPTMVCRQRNRSSNDVTRKMLTREALTCWEYQYLILAWFIETYALPNIEVPEYIEQML